MLIKKERKTNRCAGPWRDGYRGRTRSCRRRWWCGGWRRLLFRPGVGWSSALNHSPAICRRSGGRIRSERLRSTRSSASTCGGTWAFPQGCNVHLSDRCITGSHGSDRLILPGLFSVCRILCTRGSLDARHDQSRSYVGLRKI